MEGRDWEISLVLVDPAKGEIGTYADLKDCDGVFVCVPTPQDDDGTCDTGPLENVLTNLKAINYQGVIISKCTAPPSTYEKLNEDFPNLVHAPEFLTAANAVLDYQRGYFAVIGGRVKAYLREAERIIRLGQESLGDNVQFCSIGEASLAKYTINTFLASKVVFMNELHGIAVASGLSYETIMSMVKMDKRIGTSHMQVPGPDGAFGFGGACFPKDTSALLKYAESLDITPMVLEAAVKKNTFLRLTEPK
jgi:UDPglucose 6-dehydrogenase